jgi:hypothetical protein
MMRKKRKRMRCMKGQKKRKEIDLHKDHPKCVKNGFQDLMNCLMLFQRLYLQKWKKVR